MNKTLVLSTLVFALQFSPLARAEDAVNAASTPKDTHEKALLNQKAPAIKGDVAAPKGEAKKDCDCECKHHNKGDKKKCKHCEMKHKGEHEHAAEQKEAAPADKK